MKRFLSLFMAVLIVFASLFTVSAYEEVVTDKNAVLSALYEADISTIREAIDLKIISCEELTAYYLERIEKYNTPYNCFITLCDDAIEVAKHRDEALSKGENDGLLFGIPVVVKDNIDIKGLYTTNGHTLDKSKIADSNATVVNYLLEQGAIIIGKTNMSTDAQDARISYSEIKGQTKNAYNTLLASGGSSGGTAVAVSLNFAVAGLGTDTNSSLRIPAVLNGCVSLRPTLDLVDRTGCTTLNSTRDVAGAITRSVYDQAIMLDVLTNGQYKYTENLDKNALDGLKIGVLKELSYATTTASITGTEEVRNAVATRFDMSVRTEKHIDNQVASALANAIKELESCGAEIVTVSMPNLWNLSYNTFASGHKSNKQALYDEFEKTVNENGLDAIIFPSYLSTPLKSGTDENGKYWNAWSQPFSNNCRAVSPSASLPEISIPIGYHSSGAGIGLEIAGLKNSEQLLLDIAYSYTEKYNHRAVPTGAPDLYADYNADSLQAIIDSVVYQAKAKPEKSTTEKQNEPTDKTNNDKSISDYVPVFIGIGFVGVGIILTAISKKKRPKKKKVPNPEPQYDVNMQNR
ncbi:MAG: amidase [Clostridia bacterium]|nr:amidase [Clostridia bacterium]